MSFATPAHEPLSATLVANGLIEYGILTEQQLVELLGESRHSVTLNQLEIALVNRGLVSNLRLLQLKGALVGLRILDDATIGVRPVLDEKAVRATGAFVLDREPLTVALVEDSKFNLDALAGMLGTREFDTWLITSIQFDQLLRTWYQGQEDAALEATKDIYEVLDEAVRRNASDIHLQVGAPPVIRADGRMVALPRRPLDLEWMDTEMQKLVGPERYGELSNRFDIDAAYTYGSSRFRINIGADVKGPTAALRKIPVDIPSITQLGLPPSIMDLIHLERGLVLVTGPTGSGKSTTLAAMLTFIAAESGRHIITLEDPIEFHIPPGKSVVNQRELGESFESFPGGLRQALRQDPDVILVGELRDLETMRTALTAAETGHLVFGTLHTYDASSTVARLISSFEPEEQAHARAQIAYILKGIIAQTLLPRASGRGRAAAFEIMLSTPAIQNNLSKLNGHHQLNQTIETSQRDGMQTMEMALVDLVKRGVIREEDARFAAPDKEAFDRRLGFL